MANVEISHIGVPERMELEQNVQKFLEKFEKRWKIASIKIDVDVQKKDGRRKYSMHAKIIASDEVFFAKDSGWDIPSTVGLLFERLSKEIGKKLKKERQVKISTSRKLLSKEL